MALGSVHLSPANTIGQAAKAARAERVVIVRVEPAAESEPGLPGTASDTPMREIGTPARRHEP